MVERSFTTRLSVVGGAEARREYDSLGAAGKAALQEIERGQKSAASAAVFADAMRADESFRRLKAAVDPAHAALLRYEAAVETSTRAVRAQVATERDAQRVMALARAEYERTTLAIRQFDRAQDAAGVSSGRMGAQLQNAGYQVGDFFVQVGGGVDATRALAQQLPQLLGGFGVVGAVAGAVFAAGSALIPMFLDTGDAAEDAGSGLDAFSAALQAFDAYAARARATTREMAGAFGRFGDQQRANAGYLADAAARSAVETITKADENPFLADIDAAVAALATYEGKAASLARNRQLGAPESDLLAQSEAVAIFEQEAIDATAAIGLVPDQVRALRTALDDLGDSAALPEMGATAQRALDIIRQFYAEGTDLPAPLRDLATELDTVAGSVAASLEAAAIAQAEAVARYTERTETLLGLTEDRALVEAALNDATLEGLAAEEARAREAIAAIDAQIEAATDAEGRYAAMTATIDTLRGIMDRVDFDGEGELRGSVAALDDLLGLSADSVADLNDADLSDLEDRMRRLAEIADALLSSIDGSIDSLASGVSAADAYGEYQRTRVQSDRTARTRSLNEAAASGILDLIATAEGTDGYGRDGYNETLGYGRWTGGDVTLVNMTLREILALQRSMRTPENREVYGDGGSSALGRYQIVGQTLGGRNTDGSGGLIAALGLSLDEQFTPALQDRLALELLRQGGSSVSGAQATWEGLQNVSPDLIGRALGQQVIPDHDPEAARAAEAASRDAVRAEADAERQALQTATAYERLLGAMNPVVAIEQEFARAQDTINAALAQGLITADEASAAMNGVSAAMRESLAALQDSLDAEAAKEIAEAWKELNGIIGQGKEALIDFALGGENAFEALITTIKRAAVEFLLFGTGPGAGVFNLVMGALSSGTATTIGAGVDANLAHNLGASVGAGADFSGASLLSYDGGGYTPAGPRSGGLDGRGGFAAMLHPNEVVLDLAQAQRPAGSAPVLNITVNGARGNAEIAEMVEIGVNAGLARNNRALAQAQRRGT